MPNPTNATTQHLADDTLEILARLPVSPWRLPQKQTKWKPIDVSVALLAEDLALSRLEIERHLKLLQEEGFPIVVHRVRGRASRVAFIDRFEAGVTAARAIAESYVNRTLA